MQQQICMGQGLGKPTGNCEFKVSDYNNDGVILFGRRFTIQIQYRSIKSRLINYR